MSDQSGLLPPAGPVSDRDWRGQVSSSCNSTDSLELHQGELTSQSSKDSTTPYYVEAKFLREHRALRHDRFLMPLFTVELTKLSRVYVDYVSMIDWTQITS